MLTYVTQRVLLGILTIWAVSVISFVIIQLPPGDFVDTYIAKLESQGTSVGQAEADLMRAQYGLADPGGVQYVKWMGQVVQGNYGQSLDYGEPVSNIIGDRLLVPVVGPHSALPFPLPVSRPAG